MTGKAELLLRDRQKHLNGFAVGPRRMAQFARQFPLRMHRLSLGHIGMTRGTIRGTARNTRVVRRQKRTLHQEQTEESVR